MLSLVELGEVSDAGRNVILRVVSGGFCFQLMRQRVRDLPLRVTSHSLSLSLIAAYQASHFTCYVHCCPNIQPIDMYIASIHP